MRVVILAGGMGTRLQEETATRPKPMVEIGGEPLLWHIMKHYAHHGHDHFCIALGYKGNQIKDYFLDCYQLAGSLTIDFARGDVRRAARCSEDWTVNLVETGINTLTGGRIKRLQPWLQDEAFMATYGDGVSNVDLAALLKFHRRQGRLATITAVRPPARFGGLILNGPMVASFTEKPSAGEGWINGGFFVFEPGVMDLISDDQCNLEADVLPRLANAGQLAAFPHEGFWQCMDTVRERNYLERLWQEGHAPWAMWASRGGGAGTADRESDNSEEAKRVA